MKKGILLFKLCCLFVLFLTISWVVNIWFQDDKNVKLFERREKQIEKTIKNYLK